MLLFAYLSKLQTGSTRKPIAPERPFMTVDTKFETDTSGGNMTIPR